MKNCWIFLLSSLCLLLCHCRPRPPQLKSLAYHCDTPHNQGLQIQFLGNTNILLDDGQTRILTDGFFSRPGPFRVVAGKVRPIEKRVRICLERAGISELDAVIPVHSHYDHAMDAPLVAERTGAKLWGSQSTMMIGEGWGLPAKQMQLAPLNQEVSIGNFHLRFVASKHWQYPKKKQRERLLDQELSEPLVPPASVFDYKEGISYTLLIRHGEHRIAIQGSAGYVENALSDFDADILFLSVAGLEAMDEAYISGYQKHVVEALNPEVIVPIHWDDFTVPLKKRLKPPSLLMTIASGSNLRKALEIVQERNPQRALLFLDLWERNAVESLKDAYQER